MNAHVRNCASGMIAFAAASAAFPVCAFADEGAGINAILPQMEEFIPMLVAFTGFEFMVAFLQAFIFSLLTAVYIGGALHPAH